MQLITVHWLLMILLSLKDNMKWTMKSINYNGSPMLLEQSCFEDYRLECIVFINDNLCNLLSLVVPDDEEQDSPPIILANQCQKRWREWPDYWILNRHSYFMLRPGFVPLRYWPRSDWTRDLRLERAKCLTGLHHRSSTHCMLFII